MTLSWENVQNEERRGSTPALKNYSIPGTDRGRGSLRRDREGMDGKDGENPEKCVVIEVKEKTSNAMEKGQPCEIQP